MIDYGLIEVRRTSEALREGIAELIRRRDRAVREAHEEGLSVTQIAAEAGVTRPTIYRILRDAGR